MATEQRQAASGGDLEREEALDLYRRVRLIRRFEETVQALFLRGERTPEDNIERDMAVLSQHAARYHSSRYPRLPTFWARVEPIWITALSAS